MPRQLEIIELGAPVLRTKTRNIEDLTQEGLKTLIDDMFHTVDQVNGVGLAAPQVNESISLFVIFSEPNDRYPEAPEVGPIAIINPEIISYSDEKEKGWEGCLSIPGLRGLVPRHKRIEVRYTDLNGNEKMSAFSDFPARIFQHEFDHINGIVFLDRLDSTSDIYTEKEYRKLFE